VHLVPRANSIDHNPEYKGKLETDRLVRVLPNVSSDRVCFMQPRATLTIRFHVQRARPGFQNVNITGCQFF